MPSKLPAEEDGTLVLIRPDVDAMASQKARSMAAKALADWGLAGLADDVTLCVSEMVTNALNAEAGEIAVRMEWHKDEQLIEVAVRDNAPGVPRQREPSAYDLAGRGLNIVEALADEWGHRTEGNGKAVWAWFRTSPGETSDAR